MSSATARAWRELLADVLAAHIARFPPLAGRLERIGPGLVRPSDRSAAKRVLVGLLRRG